MTSLENSQEYSDLAHDRVVVGSRISIPTSEFQFTFARSSGPGGQNVNKVNTKARMTWAIFESPSLPEDVRQRFVEKFGNHINGEDEFFLTSQRYRDQRKNISDCIEKLREMIERVAEPPKPRKKTRPTLASRKRRLEDKQKNSQKKQRRQRPKWDD